MATIPTAPLIQIITCRPGKSLEDVLQRHHDAMEHKLDVVNSDGAHGSVIMWSGANAFKAMLAAGEFQDKQRTLQRRIDTDRQFDIAMGPTRVAFEKSGRSVSDAKAILVTTGKLTTGATPTDFFKELDAKDGGAAAGQAAGGIPGIVSEVFLQGSQGREAKLIGGAYLFVDEQSMEAYLASELWAKVQSETPWEEVKVERFVLSEGVPSAA